LPTGYAALDAVLPEGGWLQGSLTEVVAPQWGIGELQLFVPAMAAASQAKKQLAWIAPPHIPYAPALVSNGISLDHLLVLTPVHQKDIPWAMELVLRQRRCAIALTWPGQLAPKMVRRLQLAAEEGESLGVLFQSNDRNSSFAATRLLLTPSETGLQVTILKSRSAHCNQTVTISFANAPSCQKSHP
jgi:cell division inhibitor SulA/protein ImuA